MVFIEEVFEPIFENVESIKGWQALVYGCDEGDIDDDGDEKKKKGITRKLPAPILTRWWYVGVAAVHLWNYYLIILRATQIVINLYGSDSRPNKIASHMQSYMIEPTLISDLALLKSFHVSFLNPHFRWIQASDDLSGLPAFQSHQILVRFFLMQQDLSSIRDTVLTNHPDFIDFRESLVTLTDEDRKLQEKKVNVFMTESVSALNKHFKRWANRQLLPAALLSERPLAAIVARLIKTEEGRNASSSGATSPGKFKSEVHDREIDLAAFEEFVQKWMRPYYAVGTSTTELPDLVTAAVDLVDTGHDLRVEIDHPDTINRELVAVQGYMFEQYLPLASNTQFVESGVKEAKIVATTGRHEELRSIYAIIRDRDIS